MGMAAGSGLDVSMEPGVTGDRGAGRDGMPAGCGLLGMGDVGLAWTAVLVAPSNCLNPRQTQQAGQAAERPPVLLADQPRQQVRLAVTQPQPRRHAPRPEGRQGLPGHQDRRSDGGVLHLEVQHDLLLAGHLRRHADDHPPIGR